MSRWGMVIDLRKCIGCNTCSAACSQSNNIPNYFWRKVNDCGISGNSDSQRLFLPMSCMHCSEAPCLEVCPTTATFRRPDGIVDINHKLCVGCGYCILACPYKARAIFHHGSNFDNHNELQKRAINDSDVDRIGVCTKCNFCLPIIDSGLARGQSPGNDPEASPMCVISCSSNALYFGDLDDPNSMVSKLIQENKTTRLHEQLGTAPSVYYIQIPGWQGTNCLTEK
jgi:phenylacetyl-CoA:acceptor oxidoreductase subunit 1